MLSALAALVLAACGSKTALRVPLPPPDLALGADFSCIRFGTGVVRGWGSNSSGQLGDGTFTDREVAADVVGVAFAAQISAGVTHGCARINDGTVRCWGAISPWDTGSATPARVDGLTGVEQVECGAYANCARVTDGTVRCWGSPILRFFGFEVVPSAATTAFHAPTEVPGLRDVAQIDCDFGSCGVALTNGAVRFWGSLGHAGFLMWQRDVSDPVEWLSDVRRVAMFGSFGSEHYCALRRDGTLRCARFDPGAGAPIADVPARAALEDPGLTDVEDVVAGNAFICALDRGGDVYCWGSNAYGQLGDGTTVAHVEPRRVPGLGIVRRIAAGLRHVCVTLDDHSVYCWGENRSGQLGDGTHDDRSSAVRAITGIEPSGEPVPSGRSSPPMTRASCGPREVIGYDPGCGEADGVPICREQLAFPDGGVAAMCGCNGVTTTTRVWPSATRFANGGPCRPSPTVGAAVPCGPLAPIDGDSCTRVDHDDGVRCRAAIVPGGAGLEACDTECRCDASLHWHCSGFACVDPNRRYRCEGDIGEVQRCVDLGP